jgi:hypothetical protein
MLVLLTTPLLVALLVLQVVFFHWHHTQENLPEKIKRLAMKKYI